MIELTRQIFELLFDPLFAVVFVFALDLLMGDPLWIFARIPHPIVLIGNLIAAIETRLNQPTFTAGIRFTLGSLTAMAVISIVVLVAVGLTLICQTIPMGGLIYVILAATLIAYRGLYDGVQAVHKGLNSSLDDGRSAVSHIVGRDPASLDEAGVARAAIESLSENFSDGTIAPLFWFICLGLPGLAFYKAVNTLDSMIGHRNDRYEYFGKFAARLDDIVNFIPARLTGLLIVCASAILPRMSFNEAVSCMLRDAKGHKSVNAGWQEAAVAGALGISLAGPRSYGGTITEDIWMNPVGRKDATAADINRALILYRTCGLILILLFLGTAMLKVSGHLN
jgi:adenosylcobinamide-phosphate synthase